MKGLLLSLIVAVVASCFAAPFAEAQELTADDYVAFWQPQMGTWKGTFEMDGQTMPITFRMKVAPNKKCILLYDNSDEVPGTQQLQVYDPVAKHEIAWGVDKDGQRQIQSIMIDGMKKGMKAAKGVGGSWESKLFTNDGKTITTTCKWTIVEQNNTHLEVVWSDVKEDGKPKPDIRMSLERRPDKRRPSLAEGQAEELVSHYEHLKGLEFYVGKWIGKGQVPKDADNPAAGKEVTIPVTTKWILNRNVLVANWKVELNGETLNQGKWLWWWDTKTEQIRALSVMTNGGYGESIWTKQGDKWVGQWNGATGDGEDSPSVVTTSFEGSDTIIHEWTRQKRGEKPQPDYREEFRRIKSE